ncbi:hypothetical protein GQ44DRAFT_704399 [Phaeosphaeriaceae sp. PMI808]|nr:hypothetical protein GQ44DRAFT_704399 [Phaeosphaeriaceae sp. PMI808]
MFAILAHIVCASTKAVIDVLLKAVQKSWRWCPRWRTRGCPVASGLHCLTHPTSHHLISPRLASHPIALCHTAVITILWDRSYSGMDMSSLPCKLYRTGIWYISHPASCLIAAHLYRMSLEPLALSALCACGVSCCLI